MDNYNALKSYILFDFACDLTWGMDAVLKYNEVYLLINVQYEYRKYYHFPAHCFQFSYKSISNHWPTHPEIHYK